MHDHTECKDIQKQWQVQQDQIMKQYNDDIATIKLEEDQTKARYKKTQTRCYHESEQ